MNIHISGLTTECNKKLLDKIFVVTCVCCVCMCLREKEREKEHVCAFVCVCVCVCVVRVYNCSVSLPPNAHGSARISPA